MVQNYKLPNFIILGAQKSGTTSLHHALDNHSEVYVSNPKEISFFNKDENYALGIEWYASFFNKWKNEKVAGESTPSYLWDEKVPMRIKQTLPQAKFIILLRNPVDRAYSAYWYALIGGDETLSFEQALEAEPIRSEKGAAIRGFSSYVDRGLYAAHIKRFFNHFPLDQFLILIAEEYKKNPQKTLLDVTRFLDITCDESFLKAAIIVKKNLSRVPRLKYVHRLVPFFSKNFSLGAKIIRRLNLKNGVYPPMSPKIRKELAARFHKSNQELEEILQRKLDMWDE